MIDGKTAKNIRETLGRTVEEVAELSYLNEKTIRRFENNEIKKPSMMNYLSLIYCSLRRKEIIDEGEYEENEWY